MRLLKAIPLAIAMLSACSRQDVPSTRPGSEPKVSAALAEQAPVQVTSDGSIRSSRERLEQIAAEVSAWRGATSLEKAKRHAEATRNLIVGPTGPGYGDANRDGIVSGANGIGLLPAAKGDVALAIPAANSCVARDLLGGSWDNPARRWAVLEEKIAAWRPGKNTFPTLPSHAQRIVGWAALTLASSELKKAREYAGHADIHVQVSRTALTRC
ncbi:MAG: hypothetical protein ABIO80_04550 [Sphingomicrobium sp.]